MVVRLSAEQTRCLRLRSGRLVGKEREAQVGVPQLLKDLCGVQAQEPLAASLATRVRGRRLTAEEVERSRVEERSIVRTWCMRGTLHLLAREDLAWLLPLLGPVFVRKSRRRYAQLDLDEEISGKGLEIMRDLLAGEGAMTRAELAGGLAERGIGVEGQAVYHLIRRAGLEGLLCYGPNRQGEPTYVILEGMDGYGARTEAKALAELTRRYLAAYGPAGPKDLANWSGLPISQTRRAFGQVSAEMLEVEVGGQAAWMPKSRAAWLDEPVEAAGSARLLPGYDPTLLGYADRAWIVPDELARRVHPGGGLIRPVLLVDGRAAGTWKMKRKKGGITVSVEPFEPLAAGAAEAIQDEVRDIGRFLEVKASLTW